MKLNLQFKLSREQMKSQKGIAIPLVVMALVLIMHLATEISYETNVDYIANINAVNKIKAYYAAKAGMDISLLRIKIYNTAKNQYGKILADAGQGEILDMIWNFPFLWPPPVIDDTNSVDKDTINKIIKESLMDAQYEIKIEEEGSKIDLNDLASPSKTLATSTKQLLLNIFENKIAHDQKWAEENRDLPYETVINNMIDWVDEDTESLNGGTESALYSGNPETTLPPNRGFRTLDEIKLVAGMTPPIYETLSDKITIYGMKSINPNYATKEVLKSISPLITDEVIEKIEARKIDESLGGFFKDAKEFWDYLGSIGIDIPQQMQEAIPITTDKITNFRIKSTGLYGKSIHEITAVVYDISSAATTLGTQIQKQTSSQQAGQTPGQTPAGAPGSPPSNTPAKTNPQNQQQNSSKGPPQIVYWSEK